MTDREDLLLRVDGTGTVHPVGRVASQHLRSRAGEWRVLPSPREILLFRRAKDEGPTLRLAGEIRSPGALCDVVALASQSAWDGELVVMTEKGQRSFFFQGGAVIGSNSNVPDERLGETLYRFGALTRDQVEAALEVAETQSMRFGEAAIDLGFITAEALYPLLARQVEEVFYAALQIMDGAFYFFDRFDEMHLLRRHHLNAGALLLEGARRMDELKYFREKVPSDGHIPVPTQSNRASVAPGITKSPPDELMPVFRECDGKRSIREIVRRTQQLEFDVTRTIFQLANAGFVQLVAPRPQGPEAIVEVINPALIAIHVACDGAGKAGELREGLARFATGGGIYDPLFMMAGPAQNGTLKPERVARNLASLAGEDPDAWLVELLQEYVGFALFHAESLVPREVLNDLRSTVAEMLKPLRQIPTSQSTGASTPSNSAPTSNSTPPLLSLL